MSKRNWTSKPVTLNRPARGARRRGQALVETAFVIVALLLVSLGLLQYGMVYGGSLALNNLAREGARYAAVRSMITPDNATLKSNVVSHLKARAAGTIINQNAIDDASVKIERDNNTAGQQIRVRITYNLKNKSFAPDLFPLPDRYVNYQVTAGNLIEN